jgi:hypothetical protein
MLLLFQREANKLLVFVITSSNFTASQKCLGRVSKQRIERSGEM